jgi:predicted RNA-binding protein with RPS1 domain
MAMLERFRKIFKVKTQTERLAEETGYPQEYIETIEKMFRGEIKPQVIITEIDNEGKPNISLTDLPEQHDLDSIDEDK